MRKESEDEESRRKDRKWEKRSFFLAKTCWLAGCGWLVTFWQVLCVLSVTGQKNCVMRRARPETDTSVTLLACFFFLLPWLGCAICVCCCMSCCETSRWNRKYGTTSGKFIYTVVTRSISTYRTGSLCQLLLMKSLSSNTAVSVLVLTELMDFNLFCNTELLWQCRRIFLRDGKKERKKITFWKRFSNFACA